MTYFLRGFLKDHIKLYSRTHELITKPVKTPSCPSMSYLGISQYAIGQLAEFIFVRTDYNPKLNYSVYNDTAIREYLDRKKLNLITETNQPAAQEEEQAHNKQVQTKLSNRLYQDKFWIRKGEAVALIQTTEFDVELTAPVDLRVLDLNRIMQQNWRTLPLYDWIMKVEVLDQSQIQGLVPEEQYHKLPKFLEYK